MEFDELWELARERGGAVALNFLPADELVPPSPLSGKEYLFYEIVEHLADGSFRSWHSEAPFLAALARGEPGAGAPAASDGFECRYGKLRLHLAPAFIRPDVDAPEDDPARNEGIVRVEEFGILRDRMYWARAGEESYMVPPRGPGGRPGRGKNRILRVALEAFEDEPAIPLIPLHARWRY